MFPSAIFLTCRREGLGSLAAKVLSKCDEVSTETKDLEKELEELEKKVSSMGSAEITTTAAQLSDRAQVYINIPEFHTGSVSLGGIHTPFLL